MGTQHIGRLSSLRIGTRDSTVPCPAAKVYHSATSLTHSASAPAFLASSSGEQVDKPSHFIPFVNRCTVAAPNGYVVGFTPPALRSRRREDAGPLSQPHSSIRKDFISQFEQSPSLLLPSPLPVLRSCAQPIYPRREAGLGTTRTSHFAPGSTLSFKTGTRSGWWPTPSPTRTYPNGDWAPCTVGGPWIRKG